MRVLVDLIPRIKKRTMKISTPPPPPPVEDTSRERPVDRLGTAVWDLIMAYSGVISDDEMRRELEDVLVHDAKIVLGWRIVLVSSFA